MAQRLKRWESPRNEGRNDKGRGGSARQRQLKKQRQALRRRLKDQTDGHNDKSQSNKKGENQGSLLFCSIVRLTVHFTTFPQHFTALGSESDAIAFC
jgi:hypothetical protein